MNNMCRSQHIEVAAEAIYMYLRNGEYADVPWDQLPEEAEDRFCQAAHKALIAFFASATADVMPWQ